MSSPSGFGLLRLLASSTAQMYGLPLMQGLSYEQHLRSMDCPRELTTATKPPVLPSQPWQPVVPKAVLSRHPRGQALHPAQAPLGHSLCRPTTNDYGRQRQRIARACKFCRRRKVGPRNHPTLLARAALTHGLRFAAPASILDTGGASIASAMRKTVFSCQYRRVLCRRRLFPLPAR